MKKLVFDTGPFILLFTNEKSSDIARRAVAQHEEGEINIFIHPNNLSEAYRVIAEIRKQKPRVLVKDVDPITIIQSAYATLNIIQDEITTINLGRLKTKYKGKPWGDLSTAAVALSLSEEERVPVVILDGEKHFEDIKEVESIRISKLEI